MRNKEKNKGVTLVALVVTIIVLLILAGISIGMLTGNNGMIEKAQTAKAETEKRQQLEDIELAFLTSQRNSRGIIDKAILLEELIKINPEIENAIVKDENDKLPELPWIITDALGTKHRITEEGIEEYIDLAQHIKVGDYVDYQPTYIDVNKKQSVDATMLSYSSPQGGYSETEKKMLHGNGYKNSEEENGGQTFTAKKNDGTSNGVKWRVLRILDDNVELISESTIKTDYAKDFYLTGGIGYMYADQELNEICKIYGYGYGANTNIGAKYTVGGPLDTSVVQTIKGTGARSITIEDIDSLMGVYKDENDGMMKFKDGVVVNSDYGTSIVEKEIYYPTLLSTNSVGTSSGKQKNGFKNEVYEYDMRKEEDNPAIETIYRSNGDFWIGTRCSRPDKARMECRIEVY